jgi:hypothetical protein
MSTNTVIFDRGHKEDLPPVLERRLIAEYLLSKGFQYSDLRNLPVEERKILMKEACLYASVRLANIEAKNKFRKKILLPR